MKRYSQKNKTSKSISRDKRLLTMSTTHHNTNSKLDRVISRFQKRIEEANYYEAHQTLRTIANRYVNSKSYPEAIQLISHGSQSFLTAKQGGEGTDLIFYLLEVYDLAATKVDDVSVAKLIQLLVLIDPQEPNLKDVVTGMNNWSVKFGDCKFGDAHLHNAIATKLLDAGLIYEAERYFMLGTAESRDKYVSLLWNWFTQAVESQQGDPEDIAADFLSRLVLNYLFITNIEFAINSRDQFLTLLTNQFTNISVECIEKGDAFKMWYFSDIPELNFLQLLLVTCQSKDKTLFLKLKEQYSRNASKYQLQLEFLGQEYFGIVAPRQSNLLQDMMAGLLGGN